MGLKGAARLPLGLMAGYAAAGLGWLVLGNGVVQWSAADPDAARWLRLAFDLTMLFASCGVLAWAWRRGGRDEESRLADQLLENGAVACLVCDADYRVVRLNAAFRRLTGYREPDLRDASEAGYPDRALMREIHPVLIRMGSWQGEVWVRKRAGEVAPTWMHVCLVRGEHNRSSHFVIHYTDLTASKETERRLSELQNFDPLTRLPNRALFRSRLATTLSGAQQPPGQVALCIMDLDRFKTINDSLGHGVGDLLLKAVAERVSGALPGKALVAYLGGDEFALALPDADAREGAAALARKILECLAQPFRLTEREVFIGASLGISVYPGDGADVTTLMKNADTAMYRAKESGRNHFLFYAADMNARAEDILGMESDLRRALQQREFVLHYQPKVDMASRRIVGVEALLRWERPGHGLLLPEEFLPTLEETGLVIPVGEWVLREACLQLRAWRDAGIGRMSVSVNISPLQFRTPLVELVRSVIRETRIDPDCLELEVTETAILQDRSDAARTLMAIQQMGVRISMDDFGTGYSSLSYLKRFPIDILKIDKSFVHDLPADRDGAAITRAVISLAHNLNLRVVAEGVENEFQASFLLAKGCDEAQGYTFGRPQPAGLMDGLLRNYLLASEPGVQPA